jgi:hypothetical protein
MLENPQPKPQLKPKSIYTSVAATATTKATTMKNTLVKPSKPVSKRPEQVILVIELNSTHSTQVFNLMALRNTVNNYIKEQAVSRVEKSGKGNIVITLISNYSAASFLGKQALWLPIFHAFSIARIQQPESWVKLIAHGIPKQLIKENKDFTVFKEEVETFNFIKVKGNPRWLKPPTEAKQAGLVVFSVTTEEEAKACISKGLSVAGIWATPVGAATSPTCHLLVVRPGNIILMMAKSRLLASIRTSV